MSTTNKAEYDMQYAKQNLKRIPLNVQKEKYAEIQSAAQNAGESINGYIKKAIDERMERDNVITAAVKPTTTHESEQQSSTPSDVKQEKHYKPFTDADSQRIDLNKLLNDISYQFTIQDAFGKDVLATLLEKARQQATELNSDAYNHAVSSKE